MSSQQQKIRLKIPTARSKLQTNFPEDPRGDIKIIVGKKVFKLQKAFLRLQSSYFKRKFLPQVSLLNIDQGYEQTFFENVLKCFYGITIEIKRKQVLNYYPIIKFLQIQCLLKFLREDMVKNISSYDLFLLMRLAHEFNQQQIFQACLNELEKENFEQMNYSKFQLLKSSDELFKLIIKTHNRSKNQGNKGLSYTDIDQLIKEFCEEKNYSENQYHQMKFQLIDKTALTSIEYKQIFLDEVKNVKKSFIGSNSFIKSQSNNNFMFGTQGGLSSMVKPTNLTQSMISPNTVKNPSTLVSNELTLEMQNTFEKKLNQQLKHQNQTIKKQLESLKTLSEQNLKNNEQLKLILKGLEDIVKQKQDEDKRQKDLMQKMEKTIGILRSNVQEKGEMIKKLQQKVVKLEKNSNKKYVVDSDEEEEQHTIQSQIVPAHLIGQMLPGQMMPKQEQPVATFKKKPPPMIQSVAKKAPQPQEQQQELDDEDLEEMYTPRLAFIEEPLGTPKKYLPVLADLITQEGWNKKKLTPIFRRSSSNPPLGKPSDVRGRNQLLFLLKTEYGQFIGGYIAVQLPKNVSGQYIQDKGAFIFSLSKKQKFKVEKHQSSEAIFLSDSYLISFANDLSVGLDCSKEKSQCNWPSSYNSNNLQLDNMNASWLIGGNSPFYMREMQVYEVEEAEMEMVL